MADESKKIKCLFVLPDLSGGGAEKVTLTLLRHLDREKFTPSLLLFKAQGPFLTEVPDDVLLITALSAQHNPLLSFFKILWAVRHAAKSHHVVVGSLELKGIFFAVMGALLASKPSVAWVHKHLGFYLKQCHWLHRMIYWLCSALVFTISRNTVTVSAEAAESLKLLFPWCRQKITYHYNPIDFAFIDEALVLTHVDYQVPRLLAVGRLTHQKGFDVLLNAMSCVVKAIPNTELLILGEGEERQQLENILDELGLIQNVHLIGFHSPYYAMAHTDILVMSSRYEGLPTVMLEAMYCGAAIVSTKCPSGPKEILDNGQFGVLVDEENPTQLADALIVLLNNPERIKQLKELSKVRVKSFALHHICQEWQSDLARVVRI